MRAPCRQACTTTTILVRFLTAFLAFQLLYNKVPYCFPPLSTCPPFVLCFSFPPSEDFPGTTAGRGLQPHPELLREGAVHGAASQDRPAGVAPRDHLRLPRRGVDFHR